MAWVLRSAATHHVHGDAHHEKGIDPCVGDKEEVVVVVVGSHTVVDPGAVVIKALHTHVTRGTVAAARGLDHFAVRAKLLSIKLLEEI